MGLAETFCGAGETTVTLIDLMETKLIGLPLSAALKVN